MKVGDIISYGDAIYGHLQLYWHKTYLTNKEIIGSKTNKTVMHNEILERTDNIHENTTGTRRIRDRCLYVIRDMDKLVQWRMTY